MILAVFGLEKVKNVSILTLMVGLDFTNYLRLRKESN